MGSTRDKIFGEINDMVSRLLYYDRKEDQDLCVGDIERMVEAGEVTIDEMVNKFDELLRIGIGASLKVEDLRIGNLVYWNIPEKINMPHEVTGIFKDGIRTNPVSLGDNIGCYKPILLTVDLLHKLGFEKMNNVWCLEDVRLFDYNYCKGDLNLKLNTGDCPQPSIKYVHELQNLYYTLKGRMLLLY